MCLSTVYKSEEPNSVFAEYVTGVKVSGDEIVFTDITGCESVCRGSIASIDLIKNTIIVDKAS
ncbi:MAG: CooT family nickel-binding protein [Clostridiales Family XIII bacterium]|jgi:predicted RNA-binding protein|nr:CooT family nickel-binding protein [Clostridiales Family XIII bacterium]